MIKILVFYRNSFKIIKLNNLINIDKY